MEVMLRCAVPDRPGSLAALAGAIAAAGGDIESIEIVDSADGWAFDDLVVVVRDPGHLRDLVETLHSMQEVRLVHAAPSRGHPGDASTRFAVTTEAMLSGAMTFEQAAVSLLGGLLRARHAAFSTPSEAPAPGETVIVLPFGERCLVLQRDYRFTATERARAVALLRLCGTAADQSSSSSEGVG